LFLLVLRKWEASFGTTLVGNSTDGYTLGWFPLGPVNEQLRSSDDPWVQWVREQVRAKSPIRQ